MTRLYRTFTSQEEIDAQYDVEAMVADFAPVAAFFVDGSAAARRDLDPRLGLRFGPTVDEYLDFFPAAASESPGRGPAGRGRRPLLVFIHGGYWRILSAREFSLVARGPVAAGISVAVTNYALCPGVTIDEITRQSRAALAWLWAHADELDIDRERIFVAGHSAGGQQVGMLALTDWAGRYGLPGDLVKGGVAISGLFDLEPLAYSWLAPKLLLDHQTILRQSPQRWIPGTGANPPARTPPLLLTLGGDESAEFHRQTADFAAAWKAGGHRATLLEQPGCDHFTAIHGFAEPGSRLMRAIVEMVAAPQVDTGQVPDRPRGRAAPAAFPTFGPPARPLAGEGPR
ncbi:MAG: alpha/beta hydrolase [Sneathiellaceae bacterium]